MADGLPDGVGGIDAAPVARLELAVAAASAEYSARNVRSKEIAAAAARWLPASVGARSF